MPSWARMIVAPECLPCKVQWCTDLVEKLVTAIFSTKSKFSTKLKFFEICLYSKFLVMKWDRACSSGFIPCAIVSSGRGGYRGCQPLKAERRKLRHQPSPGKGQWGFGLYGYVKKTASSRTSQAVIRQGVTTVLRTMA